MSVTLAFLAAAAPQSATASVTVTRAERIDFERVERQKEQTPRRDIRRDDDGRVWIEFS